MSAPARRSLPPWRFAGKLPLSNAFSRPLTPSCYQNALSTPISCPQHRLAAPNDPSRSTPPSALPRFLSLSRRASHHSQRQLSFRQPTAPNVLTTRTPYPLQTTRLEQTARSAHPYRYSRRCSPPTGPFASTSPFCPGHLRRIRTSRYSNSRSHPPPTHCLRHPSICLTTWLSLTTTRSPKRPSPLSTRNSRTSTWTTSLMAWRSSNQGSFGCCTPY